MNRKFKYVIIDECYPVVCSEAHKHSNFINLGTVTSAGFASLRVNSENLEVSVDCWGESVSLGVKSNPPLDEYLLKRLFTEPSC